jgi:hypothetical protein
MQVQPRSLLSLLLLEGATAFDTYMPAAAANCAAGHMCFKAWTRKPSQVLQVQRAAAAYLQQPPAERGSIPPEVHLLLQLQGYPDRDQHASMVKA